MWTCPAGTDAERIHSKIIRIQIYKRKGRTHFAARHSRRKYDLAGWLQRLFSEPGIQILLACGRFTTFIFLRFCRGAAVSTFWGNRIRLRSGGLLRWLRILWRSLILRSGGCGVCRRFVCEGLRHGVRLSAPGRGRCGDSCLPHRCAAKAFACGRQGRKTALGRDRRCGRLRVSGASTQGQDKQ